MNIRHNKILNMKMLEKIRIIKQQKITNKIQFKNIKLLLKFPNFVFNIFIKWLSQQHKIIINYNIIYLAERQ